MAEGRRLGELRDEAALRGQVVELEDDVALRRVGTIRDHGERRAVRREHRLADPHVPGPGASSDLPGQDLDGIGAAVRLDAHHARGRHLVVARSAPPDGQTPMAFTVRMKKIDDPSGDHDGIESSPAGRQLVRLLAGLDPDVAGLGVDDRARERDDIGHDHDVRWRGCHRRAVAAVPAVPARPPMNGTAPP